jgi:hypothetical protein
MNTYLSVLKTVVDEAGESVDFLRVNRRVVGSITTRQTITMSTIAVTIIIFLRLLYCEQLHRFACSSCVVCGRKNVVSLFMFNDISIYTAYSSPGITYNKDTHTINYRFHISVLYI